MLYDEDLKLKVKLPVQVVGQSLNIWDAFLEEYDTDFITFAITSWLEEHCEGSYEQMANYTVGFENDSDAVLFKFCWMP